LNVIESNVNTTKIDHKRRIISFPKEERLIACGGYENEQQTDHIHTFTLIDYRNDVSCFSIPGEPIGELNWMVSGIVDLLDRLGWNLPFFHDRVR
jgi:hypothetical protein